MFKNYQEKQSSCQSGKSGLRTSNTEQILIIDITDNGPGVAPASHDNLFAPFHTSKRSGTGLGLSLCRDIMAAMKGSIHYLTPKGKPHAAFRLTVPLASGPNRFGQLLEGM
jgi:C4-dicarboxylate-specific signal transduction histidine kinase